MLTPCTECGYDLSKTAANDGGKVVCPECGKHNTLQAIADAAAASAEAEVEARVRRKDWPWLPLDVLLLLIAVSLLNLPGAFAVTPWWFLRAFWLMRARSRIAGKTPTVEKFIRTTAWICIRTWMLVVLISLCANLAVKLLA